MITILPYIFYKNKEGEREIEAGRVEAMLMLTACGKAVAKIIILIIRRRRRMCLLMSLISIIIMIIIIVTIQLYHNGIDNKMNTLMEDTLISDSIHNML